MADNGALRQYVLLRQSDELRDIYAHGSIDAVWEHFSKVLDDPTIVARNSAGEITLVALPSRDWHFSQSTDQPVTDTVALALAVTSDAAVQDLHLSIARNGTGLIAGVGADLAIDVAEHWCPGARPDVAFGTRTAALRKLGIGPGGLALPKGPTLTGKGVNVVIVDQGLNASRIPEGHYGGVWENSGTKWALLPYATTAPLSRHGDMVARNVRSIAPEATIFDCRLIPPAIAEVDQFVSDAHAAYATIAANIAKAPSVGLPNGPWVFVNAWAVYDRRLEVPAGDYSDNPAHPFNAAIQALAANGTADIVFAAGNCGQFCPHPRCGSNDRGPGHSIHGANAHPAVITAGAVRADGMWIGYSSQGPGPAQMAHEKPDLCAPSQFCEDDDAFVINGGTSTACGLVAGVVAALRSNWSPQVLPPAALKAALLANTKGSAAASWNPRFGHGILDAQAALNALV
ncbi:MAG TPA: S8 family serine peptidase [Vineibacter sp.]|nr:S8 family serine peptidase [Vineibacter sp.]